MFFAGLAAWMIFEYRYKLLLILVELCIHLCRLIPIVTVVTNLFRLVTAAGLDADHAADIRIFASLKIGVALLVLFFVENMYYSMHVTTPWLWQPFVVALNILRIVPATLGLLDLSLARKRWYE